MPRSLERNDRRDPNIKPRPTNLGAAWAQPVLDPEGTLWPSLGQAGAGWRLTPQAIRHRARNRIANWSFPSGVGES
jgi:hypothetical protein